MKRLIAKYNQPFEDDPLVEMTTLTYETPQGLRVWGGKLMKKEDKEYTQVFAIRFAAFLLYSSVLVGLHPSAREPGGRCAL